ncbi:MAG: tRNA (N6-isopentenyl adenosine(37)-C2)-methylthiotransferase MiaB [Odoribacteraceae bacterium]|jgi:tRNA-2-methylthio-N6-dimethylallyladenosine synthase|nr:tRNA (N6-isopentenyl adenosine(37)-C2)-methylthiotransferase MiaB [Odoribacteraceae bacterium]
MNKTFYIETYGCQMNVADSDVVAAILEKEGYTRVTGEDEADVILVNTCSVRENAELRARGRVQGLSRVKKRRPGALVAVIGCMAERLGETLFEQEKNVNIVVGPDAYLELPDLIRRAERGEKAINVELSTTETYPGICPSRGDATAISTFVPITRGCNNFCTYCIVPYTRGRERGRQPESVIREARAARDGGCREITLLGQNVNSYRWQDNATVVTFPELLREVARAVPDTRVRFATSHPRDMSDEILHAIAEHPNICRHVHLPAQSGSNAVLARMNRQYTREQYLERVRAIREILPGCGLTTDLFVGFSGESEADHRATLELVEQARFDAAFTFKYSERPGTVASRQLPDDVDEPTKQRRLQELIALQRRLSLASNRADVGRTMEVLVEGPSRRNTAEMSGRNEQNKVIVFPARGRRAGDTTRVRVTGCTPATLLGEIIDE